MKNLKNRISQLASQHLPDVIATRRHLHMYPELSYEEVETGRYIASRLQDLGIAHTHGIADNGVVGLIEGEKPGNQVVALRADFDALPIKEANKVPYRSRHEGIMHACGHDVHTASLLGAARILQEVRSEFGGTVKLIFQPGEERLPGGASIMIKEGVLENPRPEAIFGQHVHPPLEAGKIGLKPGYYMASADELYLTVTGRGGHAALPQDCIDPILITAHLITALQQIVSRNSDPTLPTVLTFGQVNSMGGATNIIPNEVKLKGTFRTFDEDWRFEAHKRMKNMASQLAQSMGGAAELEILVGYPSLYNNEQLTAQTKRWAVEYLGQERVVDLPVRLTAEDFAYFSRALPACFYRLGTGNAEKGFTSPVHTDTFDVDETCLEVGAGLLAWLAV